MVIYFIKVRLFAPQVSDSLLKKVGPLIMLTFFMYLEGDSLLQKMEHLLLI